MRRAASRLTAGAKAVSDCEQAASLARPCGPSGRRKSTFDGDVRDENVTRLFERGGAQGRGRSSECARVLSRGGTILVRAHVKVLPPKVRDPESFCSSNRASAVASLYIGVATNRGTNLFHTQRKQFFPPYLYHLATLAASPLACPSTKCSRLCCHHRIVDGQCNTKRR